MKNLWRRICNDMKSKAFWRGFRSVFWPDRRSVYESPRDKALNRYLETYKCKGDGQCCRMGVYCGDCLNAYLKMHMGNNCPGPGCTYCDGNGRPLPPLPLCPVQVSMAPFGYMADCELLEGHVGPHKVDGEFANECVTENCDRNLENTP